MDGEFNILANLLAQKGTTSMSTPATTLDYVRVFADSYSDAESFVESTTLGTQKYCHIC